MAFFFFPIGVASTSGNGELSSEETLESDRLDDGWIHRELFSIPCSLSFIEGIVKFLFL